MNDDDLKKRFAELKRGDAANAPPFDALIAKRPRARIPLVVKVMPVFAAAAVFLLWCGATSMSRKEMAAAPAGAVTRPPHIQLQAAAALPLDFLLDNAPVTVNLDADPLRGLKP